jgi:hypothetical protein
MAKLLIIVKAHVHFRKKREGAWQRLKLIAGIVSESRLGRRGPFSNKERGERKLRPTGKLQTKLEVPT